MAHKKEDKPVDIRNCSMCIHATDYHELNHKGEPFLCKCRFFKWSRFLYSANDVCMRFESKPEYVKQLKELKLI